MKKQEFLDPFIATAVAWSILGQAPSGLFLSLTQI